MGDIFIFAKNTIFFKSRSKFSAAMIGTKNNSINNLTVMKLLTLRVYEFINVNHRHFEYLSSSKSTLDLFTDPSDADRFDERINQLNLQINFRSCYF